MSSVGPLTRLRVVVRGRVQGVGFRWFARLCAERFALSGWVRNEPEGSVTIEVQGRAEDLGAFIEDLKTGNPAARVDGIDKKEIPTDDGQGRFVIRGSEY